jgi:spermidine synthase
LASNSLETPVLGLVARAGDLRLDARDVRERVALPALAQALSGLGLEDEYAVLGSFVAGPAALERFAGDAPANTDDHPIVQYWAPRVTYAPGFSPRARLFALLAELWFEPRELFVPSPDAGWERHVSAYSAARNRYLEAGRDVRPSARVEEMLAQVREPLLGVLSISPDFRPAYDPLLAMASRLARSDLAGARALLGELARLQPARNEARELLSRLDESVTVAPPR